MAIQPPFTDAQTQQALAVDPLTINDAGAARGIVTVLQHVVKEQDKQIQQPNNAPTYVACALVVLALLGAIVGTTGALNLADMADFAWEGLAMTKDVATIITVVGYGSTALIGVGMLTYALNNKTSTIQGPDNYQQLQQQN